MPNCYNCTNGISCVTCNAGFKFGTSGKCEPICGDGIILRGEQCDPGATFQAGCIGCVITAGYNCSGQPSICTNSGGGGGGGTGPSLSLVGSPNVNSNNLFITLATNPTFTFPNEDAMKNFMKSELPPGVKPTVYCIQKGSPELNKFDCLLIYPSGIPNRQFTIKFSYNYQGQSAQTFVTVNPFNTINAQRSRRRRTV